MKKIWHKYGAVRCEEDKIKFPSLLERNCYRALKKLRDQGKILFFLRQIPFDLPNGQRHLVDFCVFLRDEVIFLEAKGRDLDLGKLKREIVEAIYQVPIKLVYKAEYVESVLFPLEVNPAT